jgi:hypothetical protein
MTWLEQVRSYQRLAQHPDELWDFWNSPGTGAPFSPEMLCPGLLSQPLWASLQDFTHKPLLLPCRKTDKPQREAGLWGLNTGIPHSGHCVAQTKASQGDWESSGASPTQGKGGC